MTAPDCAQVRDEIQRLADEVQRLTDEVAFLTRSRDEWRDLQQRSATNATEATMELQRVREERDGVREHLTRECDRWRERALQAEAQLAAGGAK